MQIILRKALPEDREKVIEVESKSTRNLSYLPDVFDMFLSDASGEFIVAEADREVVACGKFTLVPDGSAWLEALRVIPECQGLGIGKRFYERFFDIARRKNVTTMRMYTGLKNAASKGLAELFGFRTAATFKGTWLPSQPEIAPALVRSFQLVTGADRATSLLMPYREKWGGYLVMNRTFYALTSAFCAYLAQRGFVYEDPATSSVIVLGARFMAEQALHIGLFEGDVEACLWFAMQQGAERQVEKLSCLFPTSVLDVQNTLTKYGFQLESSDFIVMQANLK